MAKRKKGTTQAGGGKRNKAENKVGAISYT